VSKRPYAEDWKRAFSKAKALAVGMPLLVTER
jgi:hypothetical protein